MPPDLLAAIANLIQTQQYRPVNKKGKPLAQFKPSAARIIIISEQNVPAIDAIIPTIIKVPPLRVRKADLDEQIKYYINLISREKCITKPSITPEALRNLQAYDFPNNLRELESTVE